jgi:hypothetical protein
LSHMVDDLDAQLESDLAVSPLIGYERAP